MRTSTCVAVAILLASLPVAAVLAQEAVQPDLRQPTSVVPTAYSPDMDMHLVSDNSKAGPNSAVSPAQAGCCGACNVCQTGDVCDSCGPGDASQCDGYKDLLQWLACHGESWLTCSTWDVRAGTVVLQRQTDMPRAIAYNSTTGATVLDASDFKYPMQGGPDIDLIHHGRDFDLEARYFAVESFEATKTVTPPTFFSFVSQPAILFTGFTSLAATDDSRLWSAEFNVRKEVIPGLFTILAGYRHIDLDETISATLSGPGFTDIISLRAVNHMDGFQLGGEGVLWRPSPSSPFRLEGDAKVGVYCDETSNLSSVAFGPTETASASGAHAAFMAEWGVTGVMQFTPHLSARAGYQGMLLDGVALAAQQASALNLNSPAGTWSTVNTGTPVYHGLVADLELSW